MAITVCQICYNIHNNYVLEAYEHSRIYKLRSWLGKTHVYRVLMWIANMLQRKFNISGAVSWKRTLEWISVSIWEWFYPWIDKNIEYLFNVNPIVIYFLFAFTKSKYLHIVWLNWRMELIKPSMLFIYIWKLNSINRFIIWIR